MSDQKRRGDSTIAIEAGGDRPALANANPFGKKEAIPKGIKYVLKIEAGPRAPGVFKLEQSMTVLGRGDQVADFDVGDESASRRHAFIEFKDGGFWLQDMGSTNGTILNGTLVSKARLADGDEIQIGTAVMRFERA